MSTAWRDRLCHRPPDSGRNYSRLHAALLRPCAIYVHQPHLNQELMARRARLLRNSTEWVPQDEPTADEALSEHAYLVGGPPV